jgi:hypothetical protein
VVNSPDRPVGNGAHTRPLRPTHNAERAFLALGNGGERWLREACGCGVARIRSKMRASVELAAPVRAGVVDRALSMAALSGRFAEGDLASIVEHLAAGSPVADLLVADDSFSAQAGTRTSGGPCCGAYACPTCAGQHLRSVVPLPAPSAGIPPRC